MTKNCSLRSFVLIGLATAALVGGDRNAVASEAEPSRLDSSINLLGPLEWGLSLGLEYGTNNTFSAKVTASNTSVPLNGLMRSDGSFWGGGVFVGYGHYYNDEGLPKGFFLRPGLMAIYIHTQYPDTDNSVHPPASVQHTFNLCYVGPYLDIGYRWLWRSGVFMSLGGAVGAGIKVYGKEVTGRRYSDPANVGPPALPYLEALLELGYRF
jgi:hypothetical protein